MPHLDWLHWTLISILIVLVVGGGVLIFTLGQMIDFFTSVFNPFSSKK